MLVLVCVDICGFYLFYLIVLLNPVFNCSKSLLSSSVDKVATGTHKFTFVILNIVFVGSITAATAGLASESSESSSLVALLFIT